MIAFLLALSLRASMRPSFSSAASIALVVVTPLASLASCQLIAGIDEKTYVGAGGAGGAGTGITAASVVGAGGMGTGAGGGTGGAGGPQVGDPLCAPGTSDSLMCPDIACTQGSQTNNCNCGACEHHCLDDSSKCQSGYCVPVSIATGQPFIYRVATNGLRLFFPSFAEPGGSMASAKVFGVSLDSIASADLPASLLVEESQVRVKVIAADCANVYYATAPASGDAVMDISHVSTSPTGLSQQPIPVSTNESFVENMVADGDTLFWVNGGATGSVRMWRSSGGVAEDVAKAQAAPFGLAVDEQYLYWSHGSDAPTGGIYRAQKNALGQQDPVVVNADHPKAIAVDSTHVYWIELGTARKIKRQKKDGSDSPEEMRISSSTFGDALAVDATHIYWIEQSNIYKLAKDSPGATPTPIAGPKTGVGSPDISWFTLDRTRIYFTHTDAANSTVMWVAK